MADAQARAARARGRAGASRRRQEVRAQHARRGVHVYRRNRAEGPETCLGVWGRTRATRVSFGGDVREEGKFRPVKNQVFSRDCRAVRAAALFEATTKPSTRRAVVCVPVRFRAISFRGAAEHVGFGARVRRSPARGGATRARAVREGDHARVVRADRRELRAMAGKRQRIVSTRGRAVVPGAGRVRRRTSARRLRLGVGGREVPRRVRADALGVLRRQTRGDDHVRGASRDDGEARPRRFTSFGYFPHARPRLSRPRARARRAPPLPRVAHLSRRLRPIERRSSCSPTPPRPTTCSPRARPRAEKAMTRTYERAATWPGRAATKRRVGTRRASKPTRPKKVRRTKKNDIPMMMVIGRLLRNSRLGTRRSKSTVSPRFETPRVSSGPPTGRASRTGARATGCVARCSLRTRGRTPIPRPPRAVY